MNHSDKSKIISEDYADLIIENYKTNPLYRREEIESVNIIDDKYAIGYVPVKEVERDSINKYGYNSFPFLYTLTGYAADETLEILQRNTLPNMGLKGNGVLLGIVDTGIDYKHSAFLYADGTSRVVRIWDQTINEDVCEGFSNYGCTYTQQDINEALKDPNPLNRVPTTDVIGHGTMVAGVAGGSSDSQSGFSGIATGSEYVIVKLKQAKRGLREFFLVPEDKICFQENDIMLGVEYLINVAEELNRPIAICMALGTNNGGHDGLGKLSDLLSSYSQKSGVSVVIAGGNEVNGRNHCEGGIDPSIGYADVELMVGGSNPSFLMEVWGSANSGISINVVTPTGEEFTSLRYGDYDSRRIDFPNDESTVWLNNIALEPDTKDELVLFRFRTPVEGIWKFRILSEHDGMSSYNIWLPVRYLIPEDTYFLEPSRNTTIVSPGNSIRPITVGAYDMHSGGIYSESSRGFSRINIIKPDFVAPGVYVRAPFLENSYGYASGTGVSSAYLTGVTALFLEWGIVRENLLTMSTINIKNYLIQGARRKELMDYPNNVWGYGSVNIHAVFDIS